jgi:hypothetical protein
VSTKVGRSEPVRLRVRDHHACSVQATSRVQSDAGDGIIFLARCRVRIRPAGHIEPPRRHAVRPSVPATPAEIPVAAAYPPPSSSNANSLCCAVSATSPELAAATPADFDPNGFRSSSPITPATQSVSAISFSAAMTRRQLPRLLSAQPSMRGVIQQIGQRNRSYSGDPDSHERCDTSPKSADAARWLPRRGGSPRRPALRPACASLGAPSSS